MRIRSVRCDDFAVVVTLFQVFIMYFDVDLPNLARDIKIDRPRMFVMDPGERPEYPAEFALLCAPAGGKITEMIVEMGLFTFVVDLPELLPVPGRQLVDLVDQDAEAFKKSVIGSVVLFVILPDPEFFILDSRAVLG